MGEGQEVRASAGHVQPGVALLLRAGEAGDGRHRSFVKIQLSDASNNRAPGNRTAGRAERT